MDWLQTCRAGGPCTGTAFIFRNRVHNCGLDWYQHLKIVVSQNRVDYDWDVATFRGPDFGITGTLCVFLDACITRRWSIIIL